jgi:hypothetical protein
MEEHKVRLLGNRLIRRIFGPEREEVTNDEGRKVHKEEFHFYSVITVHLFTVTIYIHQLDATLFKKVYSFLKHI